MDIRDRIVRLVRVKASSIKPHPANWRTHPQSQLDALADTISSLGFAGAILARELPDKSLQALDGHARLTALGDAVVPVLVTDLTEEEGLRLLATFDPLSALASVDAAKLDALLAEVKNLPAAVDSFLSVQADGARVAELLATEPGEPSIEGLNSDRPDVIRVILACEDTALFERAMQSTGTVNRARALRMICEAYLDGQAARQQKLPTEGHTPPEPPGGGGAADARGPVGR